MDYAILALPQPLLAPQAQAHHCTGAPHDARPLAYLAPGYRGYARRLQRSLEPAWRGRADGFYDKRLAECVAGKDAGQAVFQLPIYSTALQYPNLFNLVSSEAFAPFRRLGPLFLYKWYWLRDEKI